MQTRWHVQLFLMLCIFALLACHSNAQIVNVESLRTKTDTNGLFGEVDGMLTISLKQNRYHSWTFNSNLAYKHNKHYFMLVNRFNRLRTYASGQSSTFADDGFHHLRYNYKFTDLLRGELFVQSQYNEALRLKRRQLAGGGLRLKLRGTDHFRLYAGTALMFEDETINSTGEQRNQNLRLSNYLSATVLYKRFSFIATGYYQPLADSFDTYRMSASAQLSVNLFSSLFFRMGTELLQDTDHPEDVPAFTYTIKSTLGYKFGK